MSDYDFGVWDGDSSSWYTPAYESLDDGLSHAARSPPRVLPPPPPSPPLPPLSPVGLNIAPLQELAQVIERVGSPQAPQAFTSPLIRPASAPPSPLSPIVDIRTLPSPLTPLRGLTPIPERSPSLELLYPPSPTPLPRSPPHDLSRHPGPPPTSAVGTPALLPLLLPPCLASPPDSPIDYKAAALRVKFYEARRVEELHAPTPHPPCTPVDQENQVPPFPVPRPPACAFQTTGPHPHQFITVHTPPRRGVVPHCGVLPRLHQQHQPDRALDSDPPHVPLCPSIPSRSPPLFDHPPSPPHCVPAWPHLPRCLFTGNP